MAATEQMPFFKSLNQKNYNVKNRLHEKICRKLIDEKLNEGETVMSFGI